MGLLKRGVASSGSSGCLWLLSEEECRGRGRSSRSSGETSDCDHARRSAGGSGWYRDFLITVPSSRSSTEPNTANVLGKCRVSE